jgi:hypothetical protein
MTATDISKRIAQEWPRFFVGAFATWGLISGIQSLWLGISLNSFVNNRKVFGGGMFFTLSTFFFLPLYCLYLGV